MKVEEKSLCDTCTKHMVCMYSQQYKKIKQAISDLPFDDEIFLDPIHLRCKYYERYPGIR